MPPTPSASISQARVVWHHAGRTTRPCTQKAKETSKQNQTDTRTMTAQQLNGPASQHGVVGTCGGTNSQKTPCKEAPHQTGAARLCGVCFAAACQRVCRVSGGAEAAAAGACTKRNQPRSTMHTPSELHIQQAPAPTTDRDAAPTGHAQTRQAQAHREGPAANAPLAAGVQKHVRTGRAHDTRAHIGALQHTASRGEGHAQHRVTLAVRCRGRQDDACAARCFLLPACPSQGFAGTKRRSHEHGAAAAACTAPPPLAGAD